MDGMSMGTNMFQSGNMSLARIYWYIIAGVVGLCMFIRIVNASQNWLRLRACAASARNYPTKPPNAFFEAWATLTAVVREASYPQLYVPWRFFTWLTPPPVGRILILLVYWAVIIGFMTAGAIIHDASFYERLGFRNAWVSITQLPLLYLLASKCSVIGFLVGSSHERLNWMHRWVARTMFVTASVHGWHFYREYARAGMADLFFEVMSMGKYGVGAWALLGWSLVSGFVPLRHLCYEFFVLQHLVTFVLMLWLLYKHIPSYARYNLWFAIAALCFDRFLRLLLLVWQNVHFRRSSSSDCKGNQWIGHKTQIRAVSDDITVVTLKDVPFSWQAGQHLYLWMPWIGPWEAHPYTIACAHQLPDTCVCNSVQLVVRKHGGFSKRLHSRAVAANKKSPQETFTSFVTGPFGVAPRWDVYETLILVSASTGASFTLPILESVLQAKHTICTKRVDFLLTARKGDEIDYYLQRLHELLDKAHVKGIDLRVQICVTRDTKPLPSLAPVPETADVTEQEKGALLGGEEGPEDRGKGREDNEDNEDQDQDNDNDLDIEMAADTSKAILHDRDRRTSSLASTDSHVHVVSTRPDIEGAILDAVEVTGGETSVVVCGGKSLVARTRNAVARIADERAVHKGTGAQGIHLHVEEYGF